MPLRYRLTTCVVAMFLAWILVLGNYIIGNYLHLPPSSHVSYSFAGDVAVILFLCWPCKPDRFTIPMRLVRWSLPSLMEERHA